MEKEEVKISVRELVEFILRSGDIDNRRGGWADKESLAKGTRIHKKIQRQMGAAYQAEVPLNCRFCYEDLDLLVEGRAEAVLAASLFHYKELEIREVKEYLQGKGVSVRL